MYYVYAYFEPNCCYPFYIGKGTGQRAYEHLCTKELNRRNDLFHNKLKSLIAQGFKPEIHFYETDLTELEALSLERLLIQKFGRKDLNTGCLLNMTDGGFGSLSHSEETKDKIRQSWTDKRRNQSSKRMIGNTYSAGKISEKRKRVGRFYLGKLIKEYDSIAQAVLDGFQLAAIIRVCQGKRSHHGGYDWKYL